MSELTRSKAFDKSTKIVRVELPSSMDVYRVEWEIGNTIFLGRYDRSRKNAEIKFLVHLII